MTRTRRASAASIAGKLFRLVPYRFRFRAAIFLGRLIPFTRRYRSPFESTDDASARVLLRVLAYANVKYPNDAELRGFDELEGPAVIVTGHMFLNILLLRALIERGHKVAIIRTFPADPPWIGGTDIPIENILITPTIFVRLRKRLANGELAFINVDDAAAPPQWTANGERLSPAAVQFALRSGVPVLFAATRMSGGRAIATLHRPRGKSVEEVMEELQDFLKVAEPR